MKFKADTEVFEHHQCQVAAPCSPGNRKEAILGRGHSATLLGAERLASKWQKTGTPSQGGESRCCRPVVISTVVWLFINRRKKRDFAALK
ncbi:hypothetical protein EYF80_035392 [Liparis tanakae]|uniref:Uncharacterized protein n=1 Tax=Liparis tanakae TaxID=230148 RepID=A0A4Z2GNP9_9TELE|nr:hypothetical protein EYF80_035392 [Liparis tanakae]